MGCLKLPYQELKVHKSENLRVVYRKPAMEIDARHSKHYATIFPAEITINEFTNATVITQYLGGDAYTAPVIKQNSQYRYLHRDHLGSILAITDDTGNILEQRHFDAWGSISSFKKNGQETEFKHSILKRGFTGHEHFEQVSLIHMNGRMYNPRLHRFLGPDNFIQDPYNTMSYDRQAYVWNNPLMAKDPTGEIGFFMAALIGALVSVTTNGITNMVNGRGFFVGWGKAALIGAFSGAASFGIGELGQLLEGVNKLTVGAMKTFLHAFSGGLASEFSGGDFATGFLSGAVGSLAGGAATKYLKKLKGFDKFIGVSLWGGVGGGISSVVAGGSFGDGFRNGAIAAGLNHSLHSIYEQKLNSKDYDKRSGFERFLDEDLFDEPFPPEFERFGFALETKIDGWLRSGNDFFNRIGNGIGEIIKTYGVETFRQLHSAESYDPFPNPVPFGGPGPGQPGYHAYILGRGITHTFFNTQTDTLFIKNDTILIKK